VNPVNKERGILVKRQNKAVTVVELLAVIVIIAIISAIAFVVIGNLIERTKQRADEQIVSTLNEATRLYWMGNNMPSGDVFQSLDTDSSRINALFSSGYLSSIPQTNNQEISFIWNIKDQKWTIEEGGPISGSILPDYDFSTDRMIDADITYSTGNWTDQGDSISTSYGMLFFPNPQTTYTIATVARLGFNDNYQGGYGILFDITLDEQNREEGYALQIDRGYSHGEIVVRKRYVSLTGQVKEDIIIKRFPVGFNGEGEFVLSGGTKDATNPWWTESHEIRLVAELHPSITDQKIGKVYVDGQFCFEFIFESVLIGENADNNLTGYRVWTSQAVFYSLVVTE
jgi:type IV pilus assembly protein PilA